MIRLALLVAVVSACGSKQPPPPSPAPSPSAPPAEEAPPPATPDAGAPDASTPVSETAVDTSGIDMVEGNWTITRVISAGSAHTITKVPATTECLTHANILPAAHPGWPMDASKCTSQATVDGTQVMWTFSCTEAEVTIEGSGPLMFAGKKMTAAIKVSDTENLTHGVRGWRGLMKITATYVGPCD